MGILLIGVVIIIIIIIRLPWWLVLGEEDNIILWALIDCGVQWGNYCGLVPLICA